MANKWVEHCKRWSKDNNVKYAVAMSDPECKAAYKSGKGIFDDVKKVAISGAKGLLKKGIDLGAEKLKEQVGEGLFGNIGSALVGSKIPIVGNVIGEYMGNKLDSKLGTGAGFKNKRKRMNQKAGALVP